MATQSSDVKLKLLIDTKKQRVLYGEADKKFIDFLFNLLSLPLGTVVTLLKNQTVLGSLENVYESVQTLNDAYMKPGQNKDILLKPKASIYCSTTTKLLPDIVIDSSTAAKSFYLCNTKKYATCGHSVSDGVNAICPSYSNYMNQVGTYVQPPSDWNETTQQTSNSGEDNGLGFVKDVVTYMVMDDLSVKPMSTISSITLLKEFNIKDVGVLEEKLITLDVNEGARLLGASLQSKTVLTDVFLVKINLS